MPTKSKRGSEVGRKHKVVGNPQIKINFLLFLFQPLIVQRLLIKIDCRKQKIDEHGTANMYIYVSLGKNNNIVMNLDINLLW